eukprot:12920529-Prorocentrum_lima.AAC.1
MAFAAVKEMFQRTDEMYSKSSRLPNFSIGKRLCPFGAGSDGGGTLGLLESATVARSRSFTHPCSCRRTSSKTSGLSL